MELEDQITMEDIVEDAAVAVVVVAGGKRVQERLVPRETIHKRLLSEDPIAFVKRFEVSHWFRFFYVFKIK